MARVLTTDGATHPVDARRRRPRRLAALAMAAAAVVAACSDDGVERDESGQIIGAGDVSVFELAVGDCLDPGEQVGTEIGDIRAVPCDEEHTMEVFALPVWPDTESDVFPGSNQLSDFADAACLDEFFGYVGIDYVDSELFFSYLLPTLSGWNDADPPDRQVVCVIVTDGEPLTGSVRDSRR